MGLIKEIKEFAVKGNVVDMAVGIMIGAAFTAIVQSFVSDILMGPLGIVIGGLDFTDSFYVVKEGDPGGPYSTLETAKAAGAAIIAWGKFVNTMISFTITAIALFFLVKWVNKLRSPDTPAAPNTRACPFCRSNIDLKATKCAHCTSEVEPEAATA